VANIARATDGLKRLGAPLGLMALWLVPIISVPLVAALIGRMPWTGVQRFLLSLAFTAVPLLPFTLLGRWGLRTTYVLCMLVMLPVAGYLAMFGYLPNIDTVYVVLETKSGEVSEFLSSYGFRPVLAVLVYCVLCGIAGWFLLRSRYERRSLLIPVSALTVALLTTLATADMRAKFAKNNPFVTGAQGFIEYKQQREVQRRAAQAFAVEAPSVHRRCADPDQEVHVFIIGEAASRWHQGLYGYARMTTPALAKRQDLIVFRDVISRYTHTAKAIPSLMLVYEDPESPTLTSEPVKAALIPVLKKSGYRTWWLSNQDPAGVYDNIATVIGNTCDITKFNAIRPRVDGGLLPLLDEALASPEKKKVIFLHLMGSHASYSQRYPADRIVFPPKSAIPGRTRDQSEQINHYDNSIAYSDWLVDQVIEKVAATGLHASVIYSPDHGEDVYDVADSHMHTEQFATAPVFEIPFVVWLSQRFRSDRPEIASSIESYCDRPFMTSSFSVSYLDLLGYDEGPCDPSRSLFSPQWQPHPRIVGAENFDTDIKPIAERGSALRSPLSLLKVKSPELHERLWSHRVNSLGKLAECAPEYAGVEIDVLWLPEHNIFDVTHPPVASIGLDLGQMLEKLSEYPCGIWLDMKEMNDAKCEAASEHLVSIIAKYHIQPSRILCESHSMSALMAFKNKGFKVVWYSPTQFFRQLSGKDESSWTEADRAAVDEYKRDLLRYGIDDVSASYENIALLHAHFPDVKNFYTWGTKLRPEKSAELFAALRILGEAPWIRCLLLRSSSAHDR
jgi:heptose-I-phosphate ethanolaminephosphotransferase